MGIEARHSYRFGYLKSEHWQNLRIQKLAQCDAKCHICNHRDIANDVHHIYYPKDLFHTPLNFLVVLCRKHHEMVHSYMDANQDKIDAIKPKEGESEWATFRRHHLIFKAACQSIEGKMKAAGEACCTVFGARLQHVKQLDRMIPMKSIVGEALPREIKRARSRIEKHARECGCLDEFVELMNALDAAHKKAEAVIEGKRGKYVIDFVKRETAG